MEAFKHLPVAVDVKSGWNPSGQLLCCSSGFVNRENFPSVASTKAERSRLVI